MHRLRRQRIYEPPDGGDALRVLVERLWPRGVGKAAAGIDLWLKDVAPSDALRRWYDHDPGRWPEFRLRYRAELDANPAAVGELLRRLADRELVLVYAARDEPGSSAEVLQAYLEERAG